MNWKFKRGDIVKLKYEHYRWARLYRISNARASVDMDSNLSNVIYDVEELGENLKPISQWTNQIEQKYLILVPKKRLQIIKLETL